MAICISQNKILKNFVINVETNISINKYSNTYIYISIRSVIHYSFSVDISSVVNVESILLWQ
jgi:hypothetical protein